jgi:predicted Zn-dependent peptidase
MEHMMFKGTVKRDAIGISKAFDAMGAESNAFTSKEYTCYYARVIDEHVEDALEVLSDMVVNSAFAQDCIDSEREVVIEEIARSEDTPDDHIFDVFTDAMFPAHQLGRPILGTRQIVGAFKHDDCIAYHDSKYAAQNCVVAVSGNITHEAVVAACERLLAGMHQGTANERGSVEPQTRPTFSIVQKETEQAHIIYGMPGIPCGDDDRFAGSLMEIALGGPMSSRLFQEVREKRGLAYAVYASNTPYMHAAQFGVYAGTRPANIEQVVSVIHQEVRRMASEPMDSEELQRVQEYVVGNTMLGLEATRSRMLRLGRNAVNGLEVLSPDETIARYRAVTSEDILRVAQRVLNQPVTLAVISPEDPDTLKAKLAFLEA